VSRSAHGSPRHLAQTQRPRHGRTRGRLRLRNS
jgi:hypothetical protein